jgi:hypothetical protein
MTTRINFVNIGIIIILLISGTLVAINDAQKDKMAVVSGVNEISSSVSAYAPSSSLQAAMPEMSYDYVDNSVSVSQGIAIFGIVLLVAFMFIGFSFLRCAVSFAKEA